jgi:hypothetical protein
MDQFPQLHHAIECNKRTEEAQEQEDGTFHWILDLRYFRGSFLILSTSLLTEYPSRSQDLVGIMRVLHAGLSMPMLSKHFIQGIVSIMGSR